MKKIETDIAILGAGLTGLTIADFLRESGLNIVILEKENTVGGLAKTVEFNDFRFDLGGHRLYLRNNNLLNYIKGIVGAENLAYQRRISSIFQGGKYLKYPPYIQDFLTYKLSNILRFACDYIRRPSLAKEESTLKDWLISRTGPAIHDLYFKDYTKKVWGLGTDYMSADWAERRIGKVTKWSLLRDIFRNCNDNKENISMFHYPERGVGTICQKLAERIKSKVIFSTEIIRVNSKNGGVSDLIFRKDGEEHNLYFRQLISTIPIVSLSQYTFSLSLAQKHSLSESVNYRDLILVYLILDQERLSRDHWIYFPQPEIPFSRISEPKNWSLKMVNNNKTSLSVELFCNQGDLFWNKEDEEISEIVISALEKVSNIQKHKIKDAFVMRVPFAYPLLYLGYKRGLKMAIGQLFQLKNLFLAGRTGTHSYYDINECLINAIVSAKRIIKTTKFEK